MAQRREVRVAATPGGLGARMQDGLGAGGNGGCGAGGGGVLAADGGLVGWRMRSVAGGRGSNYWSRYFFVAVDPSFQQLGGLHVGCWSSFFQRSGLLHAAVVCGS